MTQLRPVGARSEIPEAPGTTGSELPKVLGEIKEWQSGGKLGQLTDGRYYMAAEKHVDVHKHHASGGCVKRGGDDCHDDSHTDNHTARSDEDGNYTDRGPKPPPKPRDPDACRGRGCVW